MDPGEWESRMLSERLSFFPLLACVFCSCASGLRLRSSAVRMRSACVNLPVHVHQLLSLSSKVKNVWRCETPTHIHSSSSRNDVDSKMHLLVVINEFQLVIFRASRSLPGGWQKQWVINP